MAETEVKSNCQRCGLCCMTAFLAMDNRPIGQDDKEIARWLKLHHCEPMKYPTPKGDVLAVKIPLVCEWLRFDNEKGHYYCKDYEHRPVVCREYFCKRVCPDMPEEQRKVMDVVLDIK